MNNKSLYTKYVTLCLGLGVLILPWQVQAEPTAGKNDCVSHSNTTWAADTSLIALLSGCGFTGTDGKARHMINRDTFSSPYKLDASMQSDILFTTPPSTFYEMGVASSFHFAITPATASSDCSIMPYTATSLVTAASVPANAGYYCSFLCNATECAYLHFEYNGGFSNVSSQKLAAPPAPTLSDAHISVSGTPSGSDGSTYVIGDTLTATWDNTTSGDNSVDVGLVTMDFSAVGGGVVTASNTADMWSASYTIEAWNQTDFMETGGINASNLNISVLASNVSAIVTTTDSTPLAVNNKRPWLMAAHDGGSSLTASSALIAGILIEPGTVYYVVTNNSAVPSVAQVLAGEDATGSAASISGNVVAQVNGTSYLGMETLTGLQPNTQYYYYMAVVGELGPVSTQYAKATGGTSLYDGVGRGNFTTLDYSVAIAASSHGAEANGSTPSDVEFTITVTPANSSGSAITGNIAYTGTATAGTDYVAGASSFSIADGQASTTITLAVTEDAIDEGAQETITASLSNLSQGLLGTASATANLSDDDTVGFSLSKTTASVSEFGTSDSFTVVLDSQPASNVELSVSSANSAEATVSATPPLPLIFTPSDWNSAQTVTLTGVDDGSVSDGDQSTDITISVVDANSDDSYDPVADQTLSVTTVDNDSPGFNLSSSSLSISEPSGADSFNIKLNTLPASDVLVPLSATGACSLGAVSNATLTTGNWSSGVDISVSAVDDAIDNSTDRTCTVTTGDPTSTDADYDAKGAADIADVSVNVTDDDITSATVTPSSGLTAVEGGATAGFTVTLGSEPVSPVTIALSTPSGECSAVAASTLTASNYNTGVSVTVTATDDNKDDGDQSCTVETSFSGDAAYAAINPDDVSVTVQDDDTAGVSVGTPTTASEGGATGSYSVSLDTAPTSGNVNISLTPEAQCSVSPTSLTLNGSTMSDTITVTAVDDSDIEGKHSCSVNHAISSGAVEYPSSMPIAAANIELLDNDAGVIVEPANLSVTEGGTTASYTVRLSTQPASPLVMTLSPDAQLTVDKSNLNFAADASALDAQSVTVTAVDDANDEGTHSGTVNHSMATGDGASYPDSINIASVTTSIGDNDQAPTPKPDVTLNLSVEGQGRIDSNLGLGCEDTCSDDFENGAAVTLTATPANGWYFKAWQGDCSEIGPGSLIRLFLNQSTQCSAVFAEHPNGGTTTSISRLRIINHSVRCHVDTEQNMAIIGFVISGSGEKTVLLKAKRTAITQVPDYDLQLTLMQRNEAGQWLEVARNQHWQQGLNVPNIQALPAHLQPQNTLDAALFTVLNPGVYTALAKIQSSAGVGLLSVNDLDDSTTNSQLSNLSGRCRAGEGDANAVLGFVLQGTGELDVVLRGLDVPALNSHLFDPSIELYHITPPHAQLLHSNDNWQPNNMSHLNPVLLPRADHDAGLQVQLNAGAYTLHLSPADNVSGIGVTSLDWVQ